MISPHNCTSDPRGNKNGAAYQDKKYGVGMRVWTTNALGVKSKCTVCGKK